jgi:hypothetical protein
VSKDMVDEMAPEVQRKVGIGAAESRDVVCFPSLDGAFSCVASMGVWHDQLKVEVVVVHEFSEESWGFVVKGL